MSADPVLDCRDRLAKGHKITLAAERLAISRETAALVVKRDVATCQGLMDALRDVVKAGRHKCCNRRALYDSTAPSCEHVLRWKVAGEYLTLAKIKAPADKPVFPCKCGGSGTYAKGVCFCCEGKGYKSKDDMARCAAHPAHSHNSKPNRRAAA